MVLHHLTQVKHGRDTVYLGAELGPVLPSPLMLRCGGTRPSRASARGLPLRRRGPSPIPCRGYPSLWRVPKLCHVADRAAPWPRLHVMTEPSPERGVFRWAYYHAVRDRAKFWVGSVGLATAVVVVGTQVSLPAHATTTQTIVNGLVVLAIAAVGVVAATYSYALLSAPYQQRNALRGRLTSATGSCRRSWRGHRLVLSTSEQLRQLAERLRRSIGSGQILAFRTPGRDDHDLWRSVFFEHFPALRSSVETIENRAACAHCSARTARDKRLTNPVWIRIRGVLKTSSPSSSDLSRPARVQGLLGGQFNFNWVQDGALVGLDDPTYGPTVSSLMASPEDIRGHQETFEEFFREAERLPEAKGLQGAMSASYAAEQELTRELDVLTNKDTFGTKCTLCRGQ